MPIQVYEQCYHFSRDFPRRLYIEYTNNPIVAAPYGVKYTDARRG